MNKKRLLVNNNKKWNRMCELIGMHPKNINELANVFPVKCSGYSEFFVSLQYGKKVVDLDPTVVTIDGIIVRKGDSINDKIKQNGKPDKIIMHRSKYIENMDTGNIVIPFKFWQKFAIIKHNDSEEER